VRAVVQRVRRASVTTNGLVVGAIDRGFLVLLGVTTSDTSDAANRLAARVTRLRLFEDHAGKMNLALGDVDGAVLCVSQFTLYADTRRGTRPSFDAAARPEIARPLYDEFCAAVARAGIRCERGAFGQHMNVELLNDGPVTLFIDTADLDRPRRA